MFSRRNGLGAFAAVSTVLMVGGAARAESAPAPPWYDSRYVVFVFRDDASDSRVLAVDFNKSLHPVKRSAILEYKLWLSRGGEWPMYLYELWEEPYLDGFPAKGGLTLHVQDTQALQVTYESDRLEFKLTTEAPQVFFGVSDPDVAGPMKTAHVPATLELEGKTYQGTAAYEWITIAQNRDQARPQGQGQPAAPKDHKRARALEPDSRFGLYDWIVLADDRGELWHVSAGTLTDDFGYHLDSDGQKQETDDVSIRWLKTRPDQTARQETPEAWLVDVPAWSVRIKLRLLGEHRGHGTPKRNGTRPIYRQIGVEGEGIVRGERRRFHGMVELIQD